MRIKDIQPTEQTANAVLSPDIAASQTMSEAEIIATTEELRRINIAGLSKLPSQTIPDPMRKKSVLSEEFQKNQSFLMQRVFDFALTIYKSDKLMKDVRTRAVMEKRKVSEMLFIEAVEMVKLGWNIGKERLVVKQ